MTPGRGSMLRTRATILAAAERSVAQVGVAGTTMSALATGAQIAKGTLYNHFRTKDDVLRALLADRLDELVAQCEQVASGGLGSAVEHADRALLASAALRRVARDEPAVLLPLLVPGDGALWGAARAGVAMVLAAAGLAATPTAVRQVLRHLLSALVWPVEGADAELAGRLLQAGLAGPAPVEPVGVPVPGQPPDGAGPAGT